MSKISWLVTGEEGEANNWCAHHWRNTIFYLTLSNNYWLLSTETCTIFFNLTGKNVFPRIISLTKSYNFQSLLLVIQQMHQSVPIIIPLRRYFLHKAMNDLLSDRFRWWLLWMKHWILWCRKWMGFPRQEKSLIFTGNVHISQLSTKRILPLYIMFAPLGDSASHPSYCHTLTPFRHASFKVSTSCIPAAISF